MVYDLMNLVIFCYIVLENHNCFAYHLALYYQPLYRYSLHECIRNDRTCTPSYFDISGAAIERPLTLFRQKFRSAARYFKKKAKMYVAHTIWRPRPFIICRGITTLQQRPFLPLTDSRGCSSRLLLQRLAVDILASQKNL